MNFFETLREKRKKFLDGLAVNEGDINLDLFDDFYPDKAHFIYELLQNAEDAEATEVNFRLFNTCLTFEHNGRPFDYKDVRAITGIGFSTKDDSDTIGRFGIGFKAAFLYTASPRIWSPSFAFKISEMVLPSEIPPNPALNGHTRFEFPFDSGRKPQAQALLEVRDGLEDISDNTLLFLSNIKEIQWWIDGGQEGLLLQNLHSDHHIEILREIDGRPTESSHFLRFTEPVDEMECQHIAIAFELKQLSGDVQLDTHSPLSRQFRIVPAERGHVAVYFTAAKETSNLRFHLHAPFVPELSRSSIKDTPANAPLFAQLARLAAESLSSIRDLGLLDREFLAVLPNSEDTIPPPYTPIRDAIVDEMNERPLTPTHTGGHAPANQLLQAEAGLKVLLDHEDIRFLIDSDDVPRDWAVAATRRSTEVDRFLNGLDIKPWGVEQFVEALDKRFSNKPRGCFGEEQGPDEPFLDWIRRKPAEWHRALYALFYRELGSDDIDQFDEICIVRLSDGEYRTGGECYFPTPEIREDPIHPRVAEDTYTGGGTKSEQTGARSFLGGIGVREIGEFEQVESILKTRYADPANVPPWETHESDLRRFIALFEKDRKDRNVSSLFKDYFILQRADRLWSKPNDLYLDSPYLETGLEVYYRSLGSESDRAALSDSYQTFDLREKLIQFARMCGVADCLKIIAVITCANNPAKEYLHGAPGASFTHTGINRDFVIPGFESLFEIPTIALSRLVWNTFSNPLLSAQRQETLSRLVWNQQDESIWKAIFQYNQSNAPRSADSQLAHQLRNTAWVPQGDDVFVRPAEASRDLLPDGFPFDPGWAWLTAIRFGTETKNRIEQHRRKQEIAAELGFPDEAALDHGRQFAALSPETRQRILAENAEPVDLPTRAPGNRDRRAEKVRKEAGEAPERTSEKRERSVSVNRDPIKREKTNPYLRDMYTNAGVTICQVCKGRLPFRLADGSYFFEAVEFLPDLERHHYQNYLILCPNHAAMFRHANGSKDELKDRFLTLNGSELELTLADQPVNVYFFDTHIEDLRIVLEVDNTD